MEECIVSVRNLCYSYEGSHDALRGINMDIRIGEKIAVVGSNGAGKSTFFLNLNGVLTPDQGDIVYQGQKISRKKQDLMQLRRAIGIVFQEPDNQIIATTVMGEVSFGPMNLKLPRQEVLRRVEEALADMNICQFKDRAPHYLSGGEKKRVTIADIIAMHSEVIIFDEPTASLDPLNVMMLEEALAKLEKQNKTLIISTHDVDFAYRWAERVVVFCGGKIIADDTPVKVFTDETVLTRANLKKPMLLEVQELLIKQGILHENDGHPRDIPALKNIFNERLDKN